jgi:hypothetical protein
VGPFPVVRKRCRPVQALVDFPHHPPIQHETVEMLFDSCEVLGRSEEFTAQGNHLFRNLWGTEPITLGDDVPDPSPILRNLIGGSRCGVFIRVSPLQYSLMTMGTLPCLDLWQKRANRILSDDLGRCFPGQYQHFLPIPVDVKLSRADNGGQSRIIQDGCP